MSRVIVCLLFSVLLSLGQTLTLTGPATAQPGSIVSVEVTLVHPSANLAAIQWTVDLPSEVVATVVAGAASDQAAKALYCKPDATTCVAIGTTLNLYAAGVVATYAVTVPPAMKPGKLKLLLSGVVGVTFQGESTPLKSGKDYGFTVSQR